VENEEHAAPLDDDILPALGGIEQLRELFPRLRGRIPLHVYIVRGTARYAPATATFQPTASSTLGGTLPSPPTPSRAARAD